MFVNLARRLGALIVGAALVLPFAAVAQAQDNMQTAKPPAQGDLKLFDTPARTGKDAPVTPNVAKEGQKPKAPQIAPVPVPGSTAVPGWNNPPQWGGVSESRQYASIPGVDRAQLIQGAGREWRAFRNGPLTHYSGWLLVGILAAIMVFYLFRGPIRLHGAPTGRLIERFDAVERVSHWTMAIAFVCLGLTGLIILTGKYLILPWLGYSAFSWLVIISKNLHNFMGPLFIFALVVMVLLFLKDNFFRAYDWKWFAKLGGMFGGPEVPSGRFNAGEKAWFWGGMIVLGTLVSITGLILDFPNWEQGRQLMQLANVLHAIGAVLFIGGSFGHIYLGTIGMKGAYTAMREGYVDETWAKEHHLLWYEEIKAGRRPEKIMGVAPQPAPGDD